MQREKSPNARRNNSSNILDFLRARTNGRNSIRGFLILGLTLSVVAGFALALPISSSPATPSGQLPLSLAQTPPTTFDCTQETASLSVVTPASDGGLPSAEVELEGSGFFPGSPNNAVDIYMAADSGTPSVSVGTVASGTSEPFQISVVVPGKISGTVLAPGTYYFWAENASTGANCADAAFQILGTPPPGLFCLTFTGSLTVYLPSTATGPAETAVTLNGSGYYVTGSVNLYWSNLSGTQDTIVGTVFSPTPPLGSFSQVVDVPSGYTAGTNAFWAVDGVDNCGGATFDLTSSLLAPTVSVSPTPSPILLGESTTVEVTVTGTGATPTGSVVVSDGLGGAGDMCTIATLAGGSGNCELTPTGTGILAVTAAYSGDSNYAPAAEISSLTVEQAVILLSPSTGPVGAAFQVSGGLFSPSSDATVFWNAPSLFAMTPTACTSGTFSGTTITTTSSGVFVCTFTVPTMISGSAVNPGAYQVNATNSATQATTLPDSFTVTQPTLTLKPQMGPAGLAIVVKGSGFSVSNSATVYFQGSAVVPLSGSTCVGSTIVGSVITTTHAGSFQCTLNVPTEIGGTPLTPGFYPVYGTDLSTGDQTASTSFLVTIPTISAAPDQGPMGAHFDVEGTGFSPSGYAEFFISVGSGLVLDPHSCGPGSSSARDEIRVSVSGSFNCIFDVPRSTVAHPVGAGTYELYAVDLDTTLLTATQSFTITSPKIVLDPTLGPVGSTFTVSGTGFSITSTVSLEFEVTASEEGPLTPIACTAGSIVTSQVTTNLTGGFICQFQVPALVHGVYVKAGKDSVIGQDVPTSDRATTVVFDVTVPTLLVTPKGGPVGSPLTIIGEGFTVESSVQVIFDSTVFGGTALTPPSCTAGTFSGSTITTAASGTFSCTFAVPALIGSASVARGAYTVYGIDRASGDESAFIAFTVTDPTIKISPDTGIAGATFAVAGSGFTHASDATVFFSLLTGQGVALQPASCSTGTFTGSTLTTSSPGFFSCTFKVPTNIQGTTVSPGDYAVTALDQASGYVTPAVTYIVT